jgi:ribosomal protein S12 methylthiotransferase accessory factor
MSMSMEIHFPGGRKVYSDYKGFTIKTDQSKEDGGDGTAPTPSDLFFASLGACMGLYALDFCKKRKIDPGQLKLSVELLSHEKTHIVEKMSFIIDLGPEFPQKYTSALIRAMKLCYLKQHFEQPPQFEFVTHQK